MGATRSKSRTVVRSVLGLLAALGFVLLAFALLEPGISSGEQSPRARCNSNMHQIGLAIYMYSNDDPKGRFPDDLYTLMKTEQLSSDCFVCPSTHDTPAKLRGLTDLTDGGHLSYIYIGAGLAKDSPADAVVLYEPMSNHADSGSNVLFADGHVEFLYKPDALRLSAMAQNGTRPIFWPPHPATQPSTGP